MLKGERKRRRWVYLIGACITAFFVALLLAVSREQDEKRPEFDPQSRPEVGRNFQISYDFLNTIPISEGLTCVWDFRGTNSAKCWLIDVRNESVLGEILNLRPL